MHKHIKANAYTYNRIHAGATEFIEGSCLEEEDPGNASGVICML